MLRAIAIDILDHLLEVGIIDQMVVHLDQRIQRERMVLLLHINIDINVQLAIYLTEPRQELAFRFFSEVLGIKQQQQQQQQQ